MIREYNGHMPDVSKALFIAENAVITGDVVLEEGVSVWYGAVLRGDAGPIRVGKNSNIQDNCVIHCEIGGQTTIGDNVLIGHGAIVHGCRVEDGCMIGMGAIIMNDAVIRKESLVGAGALVTEGKIFSERTLLLGRPAKPVRKLTENDLTMIREGVEEYKQFGAAYQK